MRSPAVLWASLQDNLAMSAIRFLTALAKSVHSKLFSDDSTLKQVHLASPPADL